MEDDLSELERLSDDTSGIFFPASSLSTYIYDHT
jgi:hypothetical protein